MSKKRYIRMLLGSAALGGVYVGVPLFLLLKHKAQIRAGIDTFKQKLVKEVNDYNDHLQGTKTDYKPLLKRKNTYIAATAFAVAAGLAGAADHYLLSYSNHNTNRAVHFGLMGQAWNTAKFAAAESKNGSVGFWNSVLMRAQVKTGDTLQGTTELADRGQSFLAWFADENDEDGQKIAIVDALSYSALSKKSITVCVPKTDFSRSVADGKGGVKWEPKTGPQAEQDNKKIPDYVARMNQFTDAMKANSKSALGNALAKADSVLIIEPGYIKTNGQVEIKEGVACPSQDYKAYSYPQAADWLNKPGHLPKLSK